MMRSSAVVAESSPQPYDELRRAPELWRRTLPDVARGTIIDFDALAETFELTGDALLYATIERMYRARGKLSTIGPLE